MNQQFLEAISIFVFMYPAGMAIYWVSASLCYYLYGRKTWATNLPTKCLKNAFLMVSIMVPCYNEGDNLNESIPHLLSLKYPNYELIFINDGSTDNTGELIDLWAKKDSRIVALHQTNSGKASALNHGFKYCKRQICGLY